MRDILDKLQTIVEGTTLQAATLTKRTERFETFLDMIKNQKPFLSLQDEEIIIDPKEAKRFLQLYNAGQFTGPQAAKTIDGQMIPLSQLKKTKELGGQQGKAGEIVGKETLLVKPKQIKITNVDIPAHQLYSVIVRNQILNSTEYGKAVVEVANFIANSDGPIVFPEEYQDNDKTTKSIRTAIVDYAGEYLGILALVYRRTHFPKRDVFIKWLGGEPDDFMLNFPDASNTNIADSYASISNPDGSHTINISSKGTGGGAAPAISGLKISDDIAKNAKLANAVEFINICKTFSAVEQPFQAMNLIYKVDPNAFSSKWTPFLPWNQSTINFVISSFKGKADLPEEFQPLFSNIATKSSDVTQAGTLIYAMKKEVLAAINKNNAIPEFASVVLQVLEMNFIQQYCEYKGGQLIFETQWPAKLDGKITVETKSSAKEPGKSGFSFKLGRTDNSVSDEPDEEDVDTSPAMPDVTDVAPDITKPKSSKKVKPQQIEPNIGRAKQKK